MSEIKVNKIKPALNTSKVVFKSGIQVNDSSNPLIQIPFQITKDGTTGLLKEVRTGTSANKITGEDGQVFLSRGENLSPRWGPIPTSPCPPVPEIGKMFAAGYVRGGPGMLPWCNALNVNTSFYPPTEVAYGDALGKNWKVIRVNNASYPSGAGITEDGMLYTWGYANSGRLGNGSKSTSSPFYYLYGWYCYGESRPDCYQYDSCPVRVGTQTNWADVITNGVYTAAIKTDGTMWIWGSNEYGVYGNGIRNAGTMYGSTYLHTDSNGNSIILSAEPTRLGTDSDWLKFGEQSNLYQGILSIVAIKQNGTIWSWGAESGYKGTLGYTPSTTIGSNRYQLTPKQITISDGVNNDWIYAYSSNKNLWAIKQDGSLWGSGQRSSMLLTVWNDYSAQTTLQKINGPGYSRLGPPSGQGKWKKIAAVYDGSSIFGLQQDGSVWVWGYNGNAVFNTPGTLLSIGPTNPITNIPFASSNANQNAWLEYPVKINNEVYLDIVGNADGAVLVRSDGTLWITGKIGYDQSGNKFPNYFNDYQATPFVYPYQPKWSRSLIWSKAYLTADALSSSYGTAIAGIGKEIVSAPVGSTVMWLRKNYTSLKGNTEGLCGSTVKTAIASEPAPPTGWIYCDGNSGTVNMKTYKNPITNLLDWPPIDNNDGCGNSSQTQNGTISGQITYIKKI